MCSIQVGFAQKGVSKKADYNSNASKRVYCDISLKSRLGTVLAGGPANMYMTPSSNEVKVRIKKTGGKARTTVNIYADGIFKDRMIFEIGRDTPTSEKVVRGVKNKQVHVQIVNNSALLSFGYIANIYGEHFNLLEEQKRVTGNLAIGQVKRTVFTTARSCTGKTRVVVNRTSGGARGTVRVWEKNGNSWRQIKSETMENIPADKKKVIDLNTNRLLKIEVKNISVGNALGYTINAIAIK